LEEEIGWAWKEGESNRSEELSSQEQFSPEPFSNIFMYSYHLETEEPTLVDSSIYVRVFSLLY
jgi:hypothetical protein